MSETLDLVKMLISQKVEWARCVRRAAASWHWDRGWWHHYDNSCVQNMYLICFMATGIIIFMLRQLKLQVQLIDFMPPLCGRHQHRTYPQVIIMASHAPTLLWGLGGDRCTRSPNSREHHKK